MIPDDKLSEVTQPPVANPFNTILGNILFFLMCAAIVANHQVFLN